MVIWPGVSISTYNTNEVINVLANNFKLPHVKYTVA